MLSEERLESLLDNLRQRARDTRDRLLKAYDYAIQTYTDALESETFATYGQLILPVAVLVSVVIIILLCSVLWKILYYTRFVQVLGWLFGEMLWVILSWGLIAVLCYFALNHLGSTSDGTHTSSTFGGSQTGKETANGVSHGSNSEWSNEIVSWLYSNFHKVPAPMDAWIKSLNEAAKKVTSPTKCEVLFEGFGDHNDVLQPPKISNVRVEHGPRDHLTVRSNIHLPCVKLRLVSSQRTPERMIVSNYDASIVDLRGEVECRMACIANQLYLMGCFSGRPEMDIEMRNTDPNAQYQVSIPMVEESIRRCLLSAVTNINLSEEMPEERNTFADTFSRTIYNPPTHSPSGTMRNSYNAYDSSNLPIDPYGTNSSHRSNSPTQVPDMFKKLNESHLISPAYNTNSIPNKMRIKVIKANRLGKTVSQPFVNVEMDEPAQKYSTSKGINANPYWEETFDFDLTPATEEILFEIYEGNDKLHTTDDEGFLGLAIVNFEEIRRSGETVHTLKLQGRPYRKDAISGEITVQFDFFYDPHTLTTGKLTDTVKVTNPNGSEFRETLTTHRRPIYDPHDNFDGHEPIVPSKTTTVTVKTVSQTLKEKPTIQSVHGSLENAVDPATQRILDQQFKNHADPKTRELEAKLQAVTQSLSATNTLERPPKNGSNGQNYRDQTAPPEFHEELDVRQSRDKTKKAPAEKRDRSFFGELRDRLSGRRGRSQKRSKSVDLENHMLEEAVSLPPSRDPSRTRHAVTTNDKYRETHSVGGRSGESTKSLYQHSTLVLELDHDKQAKYFLIPPAMLTEPAASRLMRKGKKLHIYNEHTFVAVKVKGGATCNVCQQRIRSSFSKQAYQCRDCKMVCHKSCHYKTDAFCTQSTVSKLQIAKDVDWAHFLSHYQLEEFISSEGGL